jgi:hypothetical protein
VRRRGRLREGPDATKLVTRLMLGVLVGGLVSQLLGSIEAVGGDREFWSKLPRTSLGAVFLSLAMAGPIRGAW